jgi:phosphoglycolate phosphatase-like HAD superfamily hydrolase
MSTFAPSSSAAAAPLKWRWLEADAYIFDIDGTLLNSRDGVHYKAFRTVLREIFGIESDLSEVPVHGNTDVGILRAVFERANAERAHVDRIDAERANADRPGHVRDFDRLLRQALDMIRAEVRRNRRQMHPEVCPGIKTLLARLRQYGRLLGVASGNLEEVAWAKLETAGLRDYFSFSAFSDATEHRTQIFANALAEARRHLGSRNKNAGLSVCIIGDTPADILAARANRLPIIAVATGIYSVEQLSQHSPDLCLNCCDGIFS